MGGITPAQAAINYLVVSVTSSSLQSITSKNPALDWTIYGSPWGSTVAAPDSTSVSGSMQVTLSITTAGPPSGAVVHYYGNSESMTVNPASNIATIYVAGVPSSLNLATLATGATNTVSLGGATASISALGSASLSNGVTPGIGILLPDKAVITVSVAGTSGGGFLPAGTYYADTGYAGGVSKGCPIGVPYPYCTFYAYGSWGYSIVNGVGSLLIGAGNNMESRVVTYTTPNSAGIGNLYYSESFQTGLKSYGNNFTITDASKNSFTGTITHAIGY